MMQTVKLANLMCFPGFRDTSWENDYAIALEQVARQMALDRESPLDADTLRWIVFRSVDHPKAQFDIVRGFVQIVAGRLEVKLNLGLSVEVMRYDRGEVYGIISMRRPEAEVIEDLEARMLHRCGAVPNLANPYDGIPMLEWLQWCIEVLESGNAEHMPEDDVHLELERQLQKTGIARKAIETALNGKKVKGFLDRPVDTILERVLRG